jgi:hypothetical protein
VNDFRRRPIILVPVNTHVEPACDDALHQLERRGYTVWRIRGYSAIDAARNQMATDALAQEFDELIWIDSDVVFQPDDVGRLRGHGLPFVCGLFAKKSRREFAATFLPGTESVRFGSHGGLTEIRFCGFGFVYTRKEVYTTVQTKFGLPTCNQRFGSLLVPFFAPLVIGDAEGYWYLGEDYAFCERARQAGFAIMADTSIRLWHVGTYRFGWEDAGSDKERFIDYTFHIRPESTPDRPD